MKTKKWLYLLVALLAVLAAIVPACSKNTTQAPLELKVGLVFSDSGAYAPMGRLLRDGTMFTINIWNDEKGGVTVDGKIGSHLIWYDMNGRLLRLIRQPDS
jgi:hypothetical protein